MHVLFQDQSFTMTIVKMRYRQAWGINGLQRGRIK